MSDPRTESALALTRGWERAEEELCTNRWFGNADSVNDAAAAATAVTVRARLAGRPAATTAEGGFLPFQLGVSRRAIRA